MPNESCLAADVGDLEVRLFLRKRGYIWLQKKSHQTKAERRDGSVGNREKTISSPLGGIQKKRGAATSQGRG